MKKHLAANKGTNGKAFYSICASRSIGNGKVRRNSRDSYQSIPQSHILPIKELKELPTDEVCSHCLDMGLITRNRQRKAKGLEPVDHLFE